MLERSQSISPSTLIPRHRFVPTVVYVRESSDFHTRLCVYNYFSELFPDVKTGASVYFWFFDLAGALVADRVIPIGYRGQLQFDISTLGRTFEGTAGVALVPDTVPAVGHNLLIGTGYYAAYFDGDGRADTSHEWEPMAFEPVESEPWICLIRPGLTPETDLIVMNAYYGDDPREGMAIWRVRLRGGQGRIIAERAMPPIPPRGSVRLPVREIFPDISDIARREAVLSLEAAGRNIMGPFTFVRAPSGDFNVHHFC